MFPSNCKLTLYSLAAFAALLLCLELLLRLAGFEFHAPEFRPPPPPCLVAGGCRSGSSGLFEKKGAVLSVRPEYAGWFHEQQLPAQKPAGEFRVFILGGSSIYNIYRPAESYYDDNGLKVRIVNLGGNSFGTVRLFPVFDEILGYAPDLVIVYSGHSEFVDIGMVNVVLGATPFQRRLRAIRRPSRVCGLLELGVYKTGMALMRIRKKRGSGFMRYFSTHKGPDTDKAAVYGLYRETLAAMAQNARRRNIPLELATVGYNRLSRPAGPAAAETLYETGTALLRAGKYTEALPALNKAQDAEQIPLGANETSNGILRTVAGKYKVPLLDIDGEISAQAPNGIPGYESFLDQCHFTNNELVWKTFRKAIHAALLERSRPAAARTDSGAR